MAVAVIETAIADFALKPGGCEGSTRNKLKQQYEAKETATNFLFSDKSEWRSCREYWLDIAGLPKLEMNDVMLIVVGYVLDKRMKEWP